MIALAVIATVLVIFVGWRWASRVWSLPCPSLVGWALESIVCFRITGTEKTLERIGLQPGQRVLEIGSGPGRLLIPAAQQVLPGGQVVGIDIQPGMVERHRARANAANLTNLTALLGNATADQWTAWIGSLAHNSARSSIVGPLPSTGRRSTAEGAGSFLRNVI